MTEVPGILQFDHFAVVSHRSRHHAQHGGYAKLADYLPGEIITVEKSKVPYRLRRLAAHYAYAASYDSDSATKEIALFSHMMKRPGGAAFFLNGEHDFNYTATTAGLFRWRTAATFHKPPDELRQHYRPGSLRHIGAAVAVGSNQVETLRELTGHDRVRFIPHGIDPDFFSPSPRPAEYTQNCIFVGQHYRDFETLRIVGDALSQRFPGLKINVLVTRHFQSRLAPRDWMIVQSGLDDETLRDLYRKSSCLLLPLRDATACNAILEALGCGTPIVTTDVGGVRDYMDETCGYICPPRDADAMIEAATTLLTNPDRNLKLRLAGPPYAARFRWEVVSAAILDFLHETLGITVAS
ncbi:MAG: glycosyltransferase family 4 protein [Chloroflexi bacterium]|nr:glycosyltransferase family 4 protein [Chloroflexota bacterium]